LIRKREKILFHTVTADCIKNDTPRQPLTPTGAATIICGSEQQLPGYLRTHKRVLLRNGHSSVKQTFSGAMMTKVNTLVITGYGTNCEVECAHAARIAGADAVEIAHFSDLETGRIRLEDFNFLIFPGGFLDGDDLGAAQAAAQRWRHAQTKDGTPLLDQLKNFFDRGGLIMGICNGFQLLVKLGLLPALDSMYFERQVSLSHNDSARYEDRWCHLKVNTHSPCVFTHGLTSLYIPVRHGEGKLIPENEETLKRLVAENLVVFQYAHPETMEVTQEYPWNPNGSPLGIAGLTDPTGRVLGLMPHPEAFNHVTNHPGWTRGESDPLGTVLFENAVAYLKKQ
jgi:phosphoribosylformylglycinamidine synthase